MLQKSPKKVGRLGNYGKIANSNQVLKHKWESEKPTKNFPTVINTEEYITSTEAVASTSTGKMVVNYLRHLHP